MDSGDTICPPIQNGRGIINFQDGIQGKGKILASFDLQVTGMLPAKFQFNWPFGSEEAENIFSRRPSLISN